MHKKDTNKFTYILLVLLLFSSCSCKQIDIRGGRGGGQPTPRSNPHTTHSTNNQHTPTPGNIGFEHYQRPQNNQHPQNNQQPQNNQNKRPDIGFENVQNRVPPNNHPTPHSSSQKPIGFENVQQRLPPQSNNPNNGYNQHPPPYPGYNPGYQHHPNSQHTYQHYSAPGGVQPVIYQPVYHSSGGSVLGYAGTFTAGYLIGRLASGGGGGGHDSGNVQYTVHHYHHNANEVPKQISVYANKIVECSQTVTQGLCVPNTFPLCLGNGTIMCITHSTYTTRCGGVNNMACIVTVLPCVSNGTPCNATAVYIPCISNVTVSQQIQRNYTTDTLNVSQNVGVINVQYCVTAIAEPKQLGSTVRSYFNFLQQLAISTYQMARASNIAQ